MEPVKRSKLKMTFGAPGSGDNLIELDGVDCTDHFSKVEMTVTPEETTTTLTLRSTVDLEIAAADMGILVEGLQEAVEAKPTQCHSGYCPEPAVMRTESGLRFCEKHKPVDFDPKRAFEPDCVCGAIYLSQECLTRAHLHGPKMKGPE